MQFLISLLFAIIIDRWQNATRQIQNIQSTYQQKPINPLHVHSVFKAYALTLVRTTITITLRLDVYGSSF